MDYDSKSKSPMRAEDFKYNMSNKHRHSKKKIDKWDHVKLKIFSAQQRNIKCKVKRQLHGMEIPANYPKTRD